MATELETIFSDMIDRLEEENKQLTEDLEYACKILQSHPSRYRMKQGEGDWSRTVCLDCHCCGPWHLENHRDRCNINPFLKRMRKLFPSVYK